jgi:hypothetical protein
MSDERTSIRVIPFSGVLKSEYRPWKFQDFSHSNKYGCMGAQQADFTHPGISGLALTDAIKQEQKTNGKAVTYLVLSCTNKAFKTVTNVKVYQNTFETWESLRKKYKPMLTTTWLVRSESSSL